MSLKVKHLNDDSTFLLTFSVPEASNIPYSALRNFSILTDPWISGDTTIFHPLLVHSKRIAPACIEHLSQLIPPPNVILISQNKPDHCHENTLKQLEPQLPGSVILAEPSSAKRIRGWKYFVPEKVFSFANYSPQDAESTVVRISIPPRKDEEQLYPGIIPGEVTLAFIPSKRDITGVHNGIGITYRPPVYADPRSPKLPMSPQIKLEPIYPRAFIGEAQRTDCTKNEATRKLPIGLGVQTYARPRSAGKVYPSRSEQPPDPLTPTTESSSPEVGATFDYTQEQRHFPNTFLPTPPDSPSRTPPDLTDFSRSKQPQTLQLPPALPQSPPLSARIPPASITVHNFGSTHNLNAQLSSNRLNRLLTSSTPNLRASQGPKKKKSLTFLGHKRATSQTDPSRPSTSSVTNLNISTPHTYTTPADAPPLPTTPLSPFFQLSPTTTVASITHPPPTPSYLPTSTIAQPKTLSVLYTPHGVPYNSLKPWLSTHLVSHAALPLTLLLHPFDTITNLWFLGGRVSTGTPGGAEIARQLMARHWISAHDGTKIDKGLLVRKVVKRVWGREEVGGLLDEGAGWEYRAELDRERPKTRVDVLRVGEERLLLRDGMGNEGIGVAIGA